MSCIKVNQVVVSSDDAHEDTAKTSYYSQSRAVLDTVKTLMHHVFGRVLGHISARCVERCELCQCRRGVASPSAGRSS